MLHVHATALTVLGFLTALPAIQDQPQPPKQSGETPQAIIDRLKDNFSKVPPRLERPDVGEETRGIQKKIIEDLEKLLEQQDDEMNPSEEANNRPNTKPPQQPMQPKQPQPQQPKELANENQPKPKPAPLAEAKPQPAKQKASSAGEAKQTGLSPVSKSVAMESKQPEAPRPTGYWGDLPQKQRVGMDAHAHDRMIRNYEELLRAYYRNIAERESTDP